MLFITKKFSTKGTKMHILRGHCIISRHFHIDSRRFRAVSGYFHVILCCVFHMVSHHIATTFVAFYCHLNEIYVNLINMCNFNSYDQFCLTPKKNTFVPFFNSPFFNSFFSNFMVNSSNVYKKKVGVSIFVLKIF